MLIAALLIASIGVVATAGLVGGLGLLLGYGIGWAHAAHRSP